MSTSELEFEKKSLMPPTEFSRRGFLTTSLIAGFTLATGPVNAQSVITTDTAGLTAGEVKVPVPDGQLPAYRAMPATGGTFPTVLVAGDLGSTSTSSDVLTLREAWGTTPWRPSSLRGRPTPPSSPRSTGGAPRPRRSRTSRS